MFSQVRILALALALVASAGCFNAGAAGPQADTSAEAGAVTVGQVMVIGDSISLGYGVLGEGPYCSGAAEFDDPGRAYPAIFTRSLGAELHLRARSGMGLVRNFNGSGGVTALELLDQTEFPVDLDLAIIHLGTNDFYAHDPGILFENTYDLLLDDLRRRYPDVSILVLSGPMLSGDDRENFDSAVSRVAERQHSKGASVTHILLSASQKEEGRYGCDWHPGIATQQQVAEVILERILHEKKR